MIEVILRIYLFSAIRVHLCSCANAVARAQVFRGKTITCDLVVSCFAAKPTLNHQIQTSVRNSFVHQHSSARAINHSKQSFTPVINNKKSYVISVFYRGSKLTLLPKPTPNQSVFSSGKLTMNGSGIGAPTLLHISLDY